MKIAIKGFLETSFIDWEGKIVAVIFLSRCNLRCRFCHAAELVLHPRSLPTVPWKLIEAYLNKHIHWIDGVVISGGEPSLYSALADLIRLIKNLSLPVKLDTNGTNPSLLSDLIKENLLDYIALDLKGPPDKYPFIVSRNIDFARIKESLTILRNSSLNYEVRTTVVPGFLDTTEFLKMLPLLQGVKKYILQQFRSGKRLDPSWQEISPYPPKKLKQFQNLLTRHGVPTIIRGVSDTI